MILLLYLTLCHGKAMCYYTNIIYFKALLLLLLFKNSRVFIGMVAVSALTGLLIIRKVNFFNSNSVELPKFLYLLVNYLHKHLFVVYDHIVTSFAHDCTLYSSVQYVLYKVLVHVRSIEKRTHIAVLVV